MMKYSVLDTYLPMATASSIDMVCPIHGHVVRMYNVCCCDSLNYHKCAATVHWTLLFLLPL